MKRRAYLSKATKDVKKLADKVKQDPSDLKTASKGLRRAKYGIKAAMPDIELLAGKPKSKRIKEGFDQNHMNNEIKELLKIIPQGRLGSHDAHDYARKNINPFNDTKHATQWDNAFRKGWENEFNVSNPDEEEDGFFVSLANAIKHGKNPYKKYPIFAKAWALGFALAQEFERG